MRFTLTLRDRKLVTTAGISGHKPTKIFAKTNTVMRRDRGCNKARTGRHNEKMEPSQKLLYKKTPNCADGKGLQYEIKVLAFLFLRALQHTQQFFIASNLDGVGAFDDVVLSYKPKDSQEWKKCFIQLKHKKSQKDITMRNLTSLRCKGDFNLLKYCKSYTEIKRRFKDSDCKHPVFRGDFKDAEVIIYTNAKMEPQLSQRHRKYHSETQALLQADEEIGSVFSFSESSDQDIYTYFDEILVLKNFLESLDFSSIPREELHIRIEELKSSLISSNSKESLRSQLTDTLKSNLHLDDVRKIRSELEGLEESSEFLKNLSFFVNQVNEKQMDNILQQEIQQICGTNCVQTISVWRKFLEAISWWWKEKNYYLTETAEFWQKIVQEILSELNHEKLIEMDRLGIKFETNYLVPFPNRPGINIVTKSPLLTCMKVCQTLETTYIITGSNSLFSSKKKILAMWPKWCTTLVVVCHDIIEKDLADIVHLHNAQRRLILVSEENINCGDSLQDVINFSQLDESSKQKIQEKEINLQGYKVTLDSILRDSKNQSIKEDILLQILQSTNITIGKSLRFEIDHFIPRVLQHCTFIHETILNGTEFCGILGVSGVCKDDLRSLSHELSVFAFVRRVDNCYEITAVDVNNWDRITTDQGQSDNEDSQNFERGIDPDLCRFTIIRNSEDFDFLCQLYPSVHWLELQRDKKLLWKRTTGDISVIQKYVIKSEGFHYNQDKIITIKDRVILIAAEPVLVPESDRSSIRPNMIWNYVEESLRDVEEGNLRLGIIDGVVNNKPHFLHRSFAEYFFALWLKRNYKENKVFLRRSLCLIELQAVLRMLNYMICEKDDLHMAVLNNDINRVQELLQEGKPVDETDDYDRIALHLAAFYNHTDIVQELLKNGGDIYRKDFLSCDALDYSESNKSWATVEMLLQHCKHDERSLVGKSDKLVLLKENITDSEYGVSALSESAEKGYTELARYLKINGIDLLNTVLNSKRQTALHIAAINKQFEIIDIVLDRVTVGAKRTKYRWRSHNINSINTRWSDCMLVRKYTDREASDRDDIDGYTPLMYALQIGELSLIEKLLEHGASTETRNKFGNTALHIAATNGQLPIVKCLTKHGADINATSRKGYTPLNIAVLQGHLPVVEYLMEKDEQARNLNRNEGEEEIRDLETH
ncbi:hypothetical protein ANN_00590 [Periplaneta americana]|uniref:Uncharacterized protein n=1 Tax=Periplaneta americana TaxID=6978 RepID=A0ABQ8TTM4_PERAM|nr:hypothetical protein ANN_00590 [Periplaneta americana]